jgi:hypothetical protein
MSKCTTIDLCDLQKIIKNLPLMSIHKKLKLLQQKAGNQFNLKHDQIILPCHLTYYHVWKISYHRTSSSCELQPYLVVFADYLMRGIKTACYLENLHKTTEYTGSQIMTLIIKFLSLIGIKRINLIDTARIDNDINLSYKMILECGRSYYHRFGFEFVIYPSFWTHLKYHQNDKYIRHRIKQCLMKINTKHKKILQILKSTPIIQYQSVINYLIKHYSLFKQLDELLDDCILELNISN